MTEQSQQRRSARLALNLPVRIFAFDFKGKDFVEDSTTLVVNRHGAKIRLVRQVVPDQEIRILCRKNGREDIFRVVAKALGTGNRCTFWGVECKNPERNIWGVHFPTLGPQDQTSVRIMLQCPECHVRELVYVDEPLLQATHEMGGLVRGCISCGYSGLWKQVPFFDS